MPLPSRLPIVPLLLCVLACGCEPAATEPATAAPAAPATTTIAYRCTGSLAVEATYGAHDATLRWPDGRSVRLPRAESASKGGGDVYVGETVSLLRGPSRIELHDGDAPPATCSEVG
jgi:hypothetical protein